MAAYPYKILKPGKYTKWSIFIISTGGVYLTYHFKGVEKGKFEFYNANDIKSAEIPKNVKETAKWALYESKDLIR